MPAMPCLNLTDLAGIADAEKLGLSILWGLYALALIGIGIARAKKHLRVGALALFGMTSDQTLLL